MSDLDDDDVVGDVFGRFVSSVEQLPCVVK